MPVFCFCSTRSPSVTSASSVACGALGTDGQAHRYDVPPMASRIVRAGTAPPRPARAHVAIPGQLWPLVALSIGLPPLFLLGLGSVAWVLPGIVFGAALVRTRGVRVPLGGGLLIALIFWILLSGLQVRSVASLALFGYRWALFLSVAMTFIWLCNVPRDEVSDAAVIRVVGWTWPVLVGFGALALIFPDVTSPSPLLRALPSGLSNHPFAVDLASVRFAEIQEFLGYPVPRPSAPFAYANAWGSAAALSLPFFLLDHVIGQSPGRRRTGLIILALGIIPVVVSLNRGLWLSCGVAVAYVACRRAVTGDVRAFVRLVTIAVAVVTVVLVSPLGGLIDDRFEQASDSNDSRQSVATEAVSRGMESPLLGFGAPTTTEDDPVAIGTHGLIWYLIYSHGFVAAGLFVAWLAGMLRVGLRLASNGGIWMTAVLVIAVVQLPIYGMLPQVVLLGVAAGLVWRARHPTPVLTAAT